MQEKPAISAPSSEAALGAASAAAGYLLWGLSVIFYKQLMDVPPFEVLAHRSVWSVVLTLLMNRPDDSAASCIIEKGRRR